VDLPKARELVAPRLPNVLEDADAEDRVERAIRKGQPDRLGGRPLRERVPRPPLGRQTREERRPVLKRERVHAIAAAEKEVAEVAVAAPPVENPGASRDESEREVVEVAVLRRADEAAECLQSERRLLAFAKPRQGCEFFGVRRGPCLPPVPTRLRVFRVGPPVGVRSRRSRRWERGGAGGGCT